MCRTLPILLGLFALVACNRAAPIEDLELTVACGQCILESVPQGCYWAAEYEGEVLPVIGPGVPVDHDSHGPGGMCTMRRKARIDGTVEGGRIIADRFDLLPAGETAPVTAHSHKH